ncbi:MAG: NAD(P)H-dependent oxidoreductase [Alphaproteobacteria bacterium]|nr:NAD(P)H-dependent oxidoreductase [Alphaproteobacteria bacterium]MBU1516693.1 NAD(P)H-dependent oxidoreductase [Alphaproteobacteria bacterium]MBU2094449.1 NAD(P)H-dependent oxidoreductase [Alphaproteobacteria bacterium]MBU2152676.1 NAD(P)H-dependent oxidoreductase [Alphaproteobacteria bacterium]MBU2306168.1 NAD(P)H-dependent oxidoreductase [Alphaproteobacteria bacterium]
MPLIAQPINCSLKADAKAPSSTDVMIGLLGEAFSKVDVRLAPTVRIAGCNVLPGVSSDEGKGDDWPGIRAKILAADILIFGTPIWMGQPSSVAKRVLERMDAFLDETDEAGRMPSYSKVAICAVVGNEDGAHNTCAQVFQALNDVGWTIPAVGGCYWVGEAMGDVDFKDLDATPRKVTKTAKMVAANAAHLARLLKAEPFPG